jgi:CheY-like chemotaxis protein
MSTALVIDDNRQTADALCRILEIVGMTARSAYGPRAALMQINEAMPDVIFLDLNMPGVDGFEVLAYLRREPRLSRIPVVVITLDDQPQTAKRARQRGALDVIIKPFTVESIEAALKLAGLSV